MEDTEIIVIDDDSDTPESANGPSDPSENAPVEPSAGEPQIEEIESQPGTSAQFDKSPIENNQNDTTADADDESGYTWTSYLNGSRWGGIPKLVIKRIRIGEEYDPPSRPPTSDLKRLEHRRQKALRKAARKAARKEAREAAIREAQEAGTEQGTKDGRKKSKLDALDDGAADTNSKSKKKAKLAAVEEEKQTATVEKEETKVTKLSFSFQF